MCRICVNYKFTHARTQARIHTHTYFRDVLRTFIVWEKRMSHRGLCAGAGAGVLIGGAKRSCLHALLNGPLRLVCSVSISWS
jgi:hypothetical protein